MLIVSSTVGSLTMTVWNRRSSAASFSMYLRYSSSVVAPTVCSSPRASIGFSMLDASIDPSDAPAPTTVCSSSMNRITCPCASVISLRTAFSRSSNSPRYFAPLRADVGWHDYQDLAGMSLGPLFGGEVSLRVLLYGEAGDDLAVAAGCLTHAGQKVQEEPEEEQHGDGEQRETAVLEAEQAGEYPEELGYHRDEGDAEGDEQREEQVEPAPPSAVPVEAVRREEQRYDDAGDAYVFGLRHQILLGPAGALLMRLLPFFQLTLGTSESILSGCSVSGCSGAAW